MNKEQEYNEFMAKLCHKAHEINEDYNNLSPENKKRVELEIDNLMRVQSAMQSMNYLSARHSC